MEKEKFSSKEGIVVTGASSGIGFSIVTFLAERGFTVFGTVRFYNDEKDKKPFFLISP